MVDTLSKGARSERMSRVRGKDTKPEMKLRRLVHGMGFRYRLHDTRLPEAPDMVFRSRRAVIFRHGCFWHRHADCALARMPKSRASFWCEKLEANRVRNRRNQLRLNEMGWRVLVVWECQLAHADRTARHVRDFLNDTMGLEHDEIG